MPPFEQMVLLYRMASLTDFVQPQSGPESRIFFRMSIADCAFRAVLISHELRHQYSRTWNIQSGTCCPVSTARHSRNPQKRIMPMWVKNKSVF